MARMSDDDRCASCWDCLQPFTRLWGVFTAVVLCGVGADIAFHHHPMGVYVIVASLMVFFFEITWAITLFLHVCLRNEYGPGLRCWDAVLWVDRWRKSLLYAALSLALFLRPHRLWLSSVAGAMLVTLAMLYLLLSCRRRREVKDTLLHDREDSYDRFDELTEGGGESPLGSGGGGGGGGGLEEQDVILEM